MQHTSSYIGPCFYKKSRAARGAGRDMKLMDLVANHGQLYRARSIEVNCTLHYFGRRKLHRSDFD